MKKLTAPAVLDVMNTTYQELAGEPPQILKYLADAVAAAFASDNKLEQLRDVVQFNREQHADQIAHMRQAHLSELLMLLRHIDGDATESDDMRLRWTRIAAAVATPVPAVKNTEPEGPTP